MSEPEVPATPQTRYWELTVAFLRELFDLQFRSFITTRMLPVVFGSGIALAALFTGYQVYLNFRDSLLEGLLWVFLFGPAMFFGLVVALRITLEFVMAMFRMAWYVEHVAGRTEQIGQSLPNFGFLRTLLYGEKAAAPTAPQRTDDKPK